MWQDFVMKLVSFGILSTVVLNLMPKETYKKYIRLTLGFLLILIIAAPAIRLFGQEHRINEIFQDIFSRVEILEAQPEFDAAGEAYQQLLKELYEEQIREMGEEPWQGTEELEKSSEN
ncbi:MAG: stage III sporulation protein AF [Lachnospiraceae bacterium]|nr:stage III sporulation protein AF [Lachnospiraceae bacterium]